MCCCGVFVLDHMNSVIHSDDLTIKQYMQGGRVRKEYFVRLRSKDKDGWINSFPPLARTRSIIPQSCCHARRCFFFFLYPSSLHRPLSSSSSVLLWLFPICLITGQNQCINRAWRRRRRISPLYDKKKKTLQCSGFSSGLFWAGVKRENMQLSDGLWKLNCSFAVKDTADTSCLSGTPAVYLCTPVQQINTLYPTS